MPEWFGADLTCRRHVITDGHEVMSLMFHGSSLKLSPDRKRGKRSVFEAGGGVRLKIVSLQEVSVTHLFHGSVHGMRVCGTTTFTFTRV